MKHKQYIFEVYIDSKREWRFRLVAPNGRIVADGAEGYKTSRGLINNINRIIEQIQIGRWIVRDTTKVE